MRRLLFSLAMPFLLAPGSETLADETSATGGVQAPATQPGGLTVPGEAQVRPAAADTVEQLTPPKVEDAEQAEVEARSANSPPAAAPPMEMPVVPAPDLTMLRLKAQIKRLRASFAETTDRLAVVEKNLASSADDNARLIAENTSLRAQIAGGETATKKVAAAAEEELAALRHELRDLRQRWSSSAIRYDFYLIGMVLALAVSLILAVAMVGQGRRLHEIVAHLTDGKAREKREEQLHVQLTDEQQKTQRLEEECTRLRHASYADGSKLEDIRRELQDLHDSSAEQKRAADERIQSLEAQAAKLAAENQRLDQAFAKAKKGLILLGQEETEENNTPEVDPDYFKTRG